MPLPVAQVRQNPHTAILKNVPVFGRIGFDHKPFIHKTFIDPGGLDKLGEGAAHGAKVLSGDIFIPGLVLIRKGLL